MYEINVPSDKPPEPEKPEAPLLSLFSSFGSKISATAQAYAPVIKTTVSSTLEKAEALVQREKEAFVLEQKKTTVPTPQALEAEESAEVLPWSSLPEAQAEQLKRQVLMLSHEKWNFLAPLNRESPPSFEPYMVGQAKALLAVDPQLNTMRFALVPTKVKEEPFWANYFSRVKFLKATLSQPVLAPASSDPPVTSPSAASSSLTPSIPSSSLASASSPLSTSPLDKPTATAKPPATAPAASQSVSVSVSGLNSARPVTAMPPSRPKQPAAVSSNSPPLSSLAPSTATTAPLTASFPHPSSDPTVVPLCALSPAAMASASSPLAVSSMPPNSVLSVSPASVPTRAPPPTPLTQSQAGEDLLAFETEEALAGMGAEGEVALTDIDELEESIDAILGLAKPKKS